MVHRNLFFLLLIFVPLSLFSQADLIFKQNALTHLNKGEYIEAVENLNVSVQKEPVLAELFYYRGFAKYRLDDFIVP